jgi:hypothetical protein
MLGLELVQTSKARGKELELRRGRGRRGKYFTLLNGRPKGFPAHDFTDFCVLLWNEKLNC